MKQYDVLLIDPPWHYNDKALGHGGAASEYAVLKDQDIYALPVGNIAANPSWCFLWVTMPKLAEGLECLKRWGYIYRTVAFTWVKLTKAGKPAMGMGHYTRGNAELVLLGTMGRVPLTNHSVSQIVMAHSARHSAKPPEVRDRIVQLCGDVPRIELFARDKADGWDATGLELDGLDIRDYLNA